MTGTLVKYVDEYSKEHDALVTTTFEGNFESPSVNVVYVSKDDDKSDQYGRLIERATSVVHKSNQKAQGRFWYSVGYSG